MNSPLYIYLIVIVISYKLILWVDFHDITNSFNECIFFYISQLKIRFFELIKEAAFNEIIGK